MGAPSYQVLLTWEGPFPAAWAMALRHVHAKCMLGQCRPEQVLLGHHLVEGGFVVCHPAVSWVMSLPLKPEAELSPQPHGLCFVVQNPAAR